MRQFSLHHFHPQLPALCLCAMRHHAMTHFYAMAACIQVRQGASNQIFWGDGWVKIIVLPGQLINDTSSGKHFSLPFLQAIPSSWSGTNEGLLVLTQRPLRALNLALQLQQSGVAPDLRVDSKHR